MLLRYYDFDVAEQGVVGTGLNHYCFSRDKLISKVTPNRSFKLHLVCNGNRSSNLVLISVVGTVEKDSVVTIMVDSVIFIEADVRTNSFINDSVSDFHFTNRNAIIVN